MHEQNRILVIDTSDIGEAPDTSAKDGEGTITVDFSVDISVGPLDNFFKLFLQL